MPGSNRVRFARPRRRAWSRTTAVATTGSGKTGEAAVAVTTTVESAD
jgi:superfamily II DNA or RNA helicase